METSVVEVELYSKKSKILANLNGFKYASDGKLCLASIHSPHIAWCTREEGHKGNHVAHGNLKKAGDCVLAYWKPIREKDNGEG